MRKKLTTSIREYRVNGKMSQQDLANRVSVRRETIVRLEKGEYNPSLQLAMDIADVFQTSVEELFSFGDNNCKEETDGAFTKRKTGIRDRRQWNMQNS